MTAMEIFWTGMDIPGNDIIAGRTEINHPYPVNLLIAVIKNQTGLAVPIGKSTLT